MFCRQFNRILCYITFAFQYFIGVDMVCSWSSIILLFGIQVLDAAAERKLASHRINAKKFGYAAACSGIISEFTFPDVH